jgi:chorismate dehydratase
MSGQPMNVYPSPKSEKDSQLLETASLMSVKIHESIRVGSVPYLNAKPLTRYISSPISLVEPTQLAADLREGRLDVGLVPLMEVLEAPEGTYRVANNVAIGSEREVFSVYLNYNVPLAKIKTVALDPASKTSVELARIVLERFHHLKPNYVSTDEVADAQLLIGDPAITHRQANPEQNYLDLATAWREQTGLPFVFAVWAIRVPSYWRALSVAQQLRKAARVGLSVRDGIARNPFERQYLREHLCYDLGDRQRKAIELFSEMLTASCRLGAEPKLIYV